MELNQTFMSENALLKLLFELSILSEGLLSKRTAEDNPSFQDILLSIRGISKQLVKELKA